MEGENIMSENLKDFSANFKFGYIDTNIADQMTISSEILETIPPQIAQRYKILPYQIVNNGEEKVLSILTSNPQILLFQQDILELVSESNIDRLDFFMVEEKQLENAINQFYNLNFSEESYVSESMIEVVNDQEEEQEDDISEVIQDNNSPIISLVNTIIRTAVLTKSSDIHFEPEETGMLVKFRIDGTLIPQRQYTISEKNKKAIIARIKIMAGLDVSKKRDTQSGQMKLKLNDVEVDFRVSMLPVINGEKAVIRILDKTTSLLDLDTLGFEEKDISIFNKIINKPTGLVLITGPTGSGKSTTLYSFLKRLDSTSKNITTIENPVEYQLQGINQVQVQEKHITFASALREILRQDPNVIMVGEIRDKDTAENAVQAAQTGHLVFSTLHTNDSLSVISRLKRLGIEPDAITQTLLCVIAQRLVKRICPYCMEEYKPNFNKYGISESDIKILTAPNDEEKAKGIKEHHFIHGKGCEKCNNTGYKGRITDYEYYTMNDNVRKMIERGDTVYDIKNYLRNEEGMKNMWEKGLILVRNNITTVEEIASEIIE